MTPISPLRPREFFSGTWIGQGELRLAGPAGWVRPPDRFHYQTRVRWVTQTRGEYTDTFEFDSGRKLVMPFVSEIVDERRLHVASPNLPTDRGPPVDVSLFRWVGPRSPPM